MSGGYNSVFKAHEGGSLSFERNTEGYRLTVVADGVGDVPAVGLQIGPWQMVALVRLFLAHISHETQLPEIEQSVQEMRADHDERERKYEERRKAYAEGRLS